MIGSYLFVLRRRMLFIICFTAVLAPMTFLALQNLTPEYRSDAVIEVGTGTVTEQIIGQQRSYEEPERRVSTEADTVTSRPVSALAARKLGLTSSAGEELLGRVQARTRPGTNYIDVTGTGSTPKSARRLTTAFTDAYLEYRRGLQQADLETLERDLVDQRRDAEASLAALPVAESTARDRAVLVDRIENAVRLVEAVRLRSSLGATGIEQLAEPSTPTEPANALAPSFAALIALLAAGLLAVALAFLIDLIRDGLRTEAEAEHVIGVPVIATVPRASRRSSGTTQSPSAARRMRLGLVRACGGALPRRIMIMGAPGEEDSGDVAALLAVACRDSASSVLVFADPPPDPGAPGALLPAPQGEQIVLSHDVIVRQSREPGVWCGLLTSTDLEVGLFDHPTAALLLEEAGRHFQNVIILADSKLGVEPRSVRPLVDAAVLVCRLGGTPARRLRRMAEELNEGDRGVDALVVTKMVPSPIGSVSSSPAGVSTEGDEWPAPPPQGLPATVRPGNRRA